MDASHLILGRPWQFDMGAWYNCRDNIYMFDWKGRWIHLLPLSNMHKVTKANVAYLSILGSQFLAGCGKKSIS